MRVSTALSVASPIASVAAATLVNRHWHNQSAIHSPSVQHEQIEGNTMPFTRTKIGPTLRAENSPNNSGCERTADLIFIQDWARTKSAKEGANLTGMTPNGFKKVQAGECAISYEKLTYAMKRDPELAALYFEHVGLLRPGEAETAAAYTKFANAAVRARL